MTTLEYKELNLHEHVLKRPDTYVGSIQPETHTEYIINDGRMVNKEIKYIPAILRVYIEALSNAIDNKWRSDEMNIPFKSIKINIDQETGETSVWNDGYAIPIEKNEKGIYIPEMLFGHLLTSSNYNDEEERYTSGKNGLGITLCNIFSTDFQVTVVNDGVKYTQLWRNNMREATPPKLRKTSTKTNYVEVKWVPDFSYFGIEGYSNDMIGIMYRYAYDAAMITGVSVYLNDERMKLKTLKDYAKLFAPSVEEESNEFLHIEYKKSEMVLMPANKRNGYEAVSFVNGIYTRDGGVHVDSWLDSIFKPLVDKVNKKYKNIKLTTKDLKQYFRIFVKAWVPNPQFASQTKDRMTAPKLATKIETNHITLLLKWGWVQDVEDLVRARELVSLKKTERKTRGYTRIEGVDAANKAGTKDSDKCVLVLCEGDSAKTFAVKGLEKGIDWGNGVYKGRDYIGIMPLRGKCLNARNANPSAIAKNKEITKLIQALGLQYDIDYSIDENFKKLRYGKLLLLTDQDYDGFHILALILNIVDSLFPTLMRRKGFLCSMQTPIMKIKHKGEELRFYNSHNAHKFLEENNVKKDNIKYYKGLGTSSDKDIKETFGKKMVVFDMDGEGKESLNKVFHSDFSDERKKWLETYNPKQEQKFIDTDYTNIQDISITDFINTEFIKFSIDDCKRSIPSMVDGLKESQRKVLYACFLKNLPGDKTIKVAQLAGFVAEKTSYHHGEQNLYDTITKMAQDFVGSNNIPLLYRDGQFGSKTQLGKDAANARYIFTRLEKHTKQLFSSDDMPLLNYLHDEGEKIEPEYYVPLLPMILVNGGSGIGTGWSCYVPSYNPTDITNWIMDWLDKGSSDVKLHPWYNGFTGQIKQLSAHKYSTHGIVQGDNKKVTITEIPVGMSIDKCKENLEELCEKRKIKNFRNQSNANKVKFEFTPLVKLKDKDLPLTSSISVTNLVLFDSNGRLHKYKDVYEILEEFCRVRLEFYLHRKNYLLDKLQRDKVFMTNKLRFMKKVMKRELVVFQRPEEEIVREMEGMKFEKVDDKYDYLLNLSIRSFTASRLEDLTKKITEVKEKIEKLKTTDIKDMWRQELNELKIR